MKIDYFDQVEKEEQNILYRQTLKQKKELYFVDKIKDKILSPIRHLKDLSEYINWDGIQSYNFVVELGEKYPQYEFLTTIENYSDYLISDYGNVLSFKTGIWSIRELTTYNGYLYVTFNKPEFIHQLIIESFMPIKMGNEFQIINHRNGIRDDNYINNIKATSSFYNTYHSIYVIGRKGSIPITRTDENGNIREYKTMNEARIKNGLARRRFFSNLREKGYFEVVCKEVGEENFLKYKFEHANKLLTENQEEVIEDNSLFEGEWFLPFTSIKIALKENNLVDEDEHEEILTENEENVDKEILYIELFFDIYEISNFARMRNKSTKKFYKTDRAGKYARVGVHSICKTQKKFLFII